MGEGRRREGGKKGEEEEGQKGGGGRRKGENREGNDNSHTHSNTFTCHTHTHTHAHTHTQVGTFSEKTTEKFGYMSSLTGKKTDAKHNAKFVFPGSWSIHCVPMEPYTRTHTHTHTHTQSSTCALSKRY